MNEKMSLFSSKDKFTTDQLNVLEKAIVRDECVRDIANPHIPAKKMSFLIKGESRGHNMQNYISDDFLACHVKDIFNKLEKGEDVTDYIHQAKDDTAHINNKIAKANLTGLNVDQLSVVQDFLAEGIDILIYAKPEYSTTCLNLIGKCLKLNKNLLDYINPKYDEAKLNLISMVIEDIDTKIILEYLKKGFTWNQIIILVGNNAKKENVKLIENPNLPAKSMHTILRGLKHGLDMKPCIDNTNLLSYHINNYYHDTYTKKSLPSNYISEYESKSNLAEAKLKSLNIDKKNYDVDQLDMIKIYLTKDINITPYINVYDDVKYLDLVGRCLLFDKPQLINKIDRNWTERTCTSFKRIIQSKEDLTDNIVDDISCTQMDLMWALSKKENRMPKWLTTEYTEPQMEVISYCLMYDIPVNIFKDKDIDLVDTINNCIPENLRGNYSYRQILEIYAGLEQGLAEEDVKKYADNKFNFLQMNTLRHLMLNGEFIPEILNEDLLDAEIRDITKLAHTGEITNIQDYIDNLLKNRSIGVLWAVDIYRSIGGLPIEKLVNKVRKTKGTRARKNYVENKMKQIYID